jgi:hypothetical protein
MKNAQRSRYYSICVSIHGPRVLINYPLGAWAYTLQLLPAFMEPAYVLAGACAAIPHRAEAVRLSCAGPFLAAAHEQMKYRISNIKLNQSFLPTMVGGSTWSIQFESFSWSSRSTARLVGEGKAERRRLERGRGQNGHGRGPWKTRWTASVDPTASMAHLSSAPSRATLVAVLERNRQRNEPRPSAAQIRKRCRAAPWVAANR